MLLFDFKNLGFTLYRGFIVDGTTNARFFWSNGCLQRSFVLATGGSSTDFFNKSIRANPKND